jgi:hypothetical protein
MKYNSQSKTCQNCKKDFIIEPDDFSFYEKIKVPAPTWCPDCRQQRRYAWRNERTLYRRNCDLCNKSTVTIYSENKDLKVYCLKCWWGDGWDPSIYGRDFDFSRPFFEQYHELQKVVPRMALLNKRSINSEYTNHSGDNKNCYLSTVCFNSEEVYYSNWILYSRNLMDCSYIHNGGGEKVYESIDSQKIYNCQHCYLLENSMDCLYCYDCQNCNNCFLSSNLRNKSYVFKNEQLTKEKYFEKLKQYNLSSYKIRQKLYKDFIDLITNNSIHKNIFIERSVNCINSNMIVNCKNLNFCFDCTDGVEDSKYLISIDSVKNAMDLYHIGWGAELSYECHACNNLYKSISCHLCYDNQELEYCDTCHNSSNLFGCISINKGEYMILNEKYSKEEYLELKEKIIEHMKKTGEYGEFFPPSIAPVCYNETQGNYYMPLIKEEVLHRGWLWEDKVPGVFGKETIQPDNLSDTIEETPNSILKEVLKCIVCSKNYNIIPDELTFYRNEKIPIPRECPDCRYKRRFNLRLPRKLWNRKCDKCSIDIQSAYAPNRPEIVYCEECYRRELY